MLGVVVTAGRKPVPVVVQLVLGLAVDLEGHRLVEGEDRSAVEGGEALAVQLETDGQYRARFLAMDFLARLAITADEGDLRVGEDADVEIGGGLGLVVEPQARGDGVDPLAHDQSPGGVERR
ncbi:hypothetical protein D9M69_603040 [compost metagenome]